MKIAKCKTFQDWRYQFNSLYLLTKDNSGIAGTLYIYVYKYIIKLKLYRITYILHFFFFCLHGTKVTLFYYVAPIVKLYIVSHRRNTDTALLLLSCFKDLSTAAIISGPKSLQINHRRHSRTRLFPASIFAHRHMANSNWL